MSSESQRAGWGAVIAAVIGIGAVVGILVSASQGVPAREPLTLTATRGVPSAEVAAGPSGIAPGSVAASSPSSPTSAHADAGDGRDGAVPVLTPPPAPVAALPSVPEAAPRPPPAELTPERRYEATAFVADLITVRLDQVRIELAEARAAHEPIRVRHLEANLAVLTEEAARLNGITRALERDLGRPGASDEAPAPDEATEETSAEDPAEE